MKKTNIYIFAVVLLAVITFPFRMYAGSDGSKFTVVIDAGHGGKDFGACDNGAKEKDINLGVALQLESLIKKKLKEADVVMTRKSDKYLTLQERADVANKAKGNLFISIHTNSVDKSNKNRKTVSGSSVYALGLHKDANNMQVARRENSVIELESNFEQKYSGFDPSKDESYIIFEMAQKKNLSNSIRFAEDVQKELVGIGRGNRGVHQAGFWVLWATSMPAVLVELDFICNPGAAKFMTSEKGSKDLAGAIFKAVEKYCDSWKKGAGSGKKSAMTEMKPEDNPILVSLAEEKGEDSYPVLLSTSKETKKKDVAPKRKKRSGSEYATARKRRSESGKAISSDRSYETKSIPLHSEKERYGIVVADAGDDVVSPQDEGNVDKKDKENQKKKKKEKKKKEKKDKKQKRNPKSHNAKIEKFVKVYKIQILASADLLKQNNPRFCGLKPISAYKENNLYKYYYGESADKGEIEALLKTVRKLIPDAFIVSSTKSEKKEKN